MVDDDYKQEPPLPPPIVVKTIFRIHKYGFQKIKDLIVLYSHDYQFLFILKSTIKLRIHYQLFCISNRQDKGFCDINVFQKTRTSSSILMFIIPMLK
jgi:hypothetical protein